MCAAPTACSPLGGVCHADGSDQMRLYTQSIISAMQDHLASSDPEIGGPLENLVLSRPSLKTKQKLHLFLNLASSL